MEDVNQKVGYLAEIEGYEKIESKGEHLDQYDFTFAFFKDFEQKELFDFIDNMRAEGVVILYVEFLWKYKFLFYWYL